MDVSKKKYNPELKENLIVTLTFQFALNIVRFTEKLEADRKFIVAKQLIRCGTSIGANVREAQDAESKADFIHKVKIAAKEADETEYWLEICHQSENYPDCEELLAQILSIKKVLSKIIATSKNNRINSSTN
ncbi:MAG: four helix bundle protein [Cyclobacteriaceae bacterium]|nr:four helix bundle protein [Cyclobacteriaceae bacterium]UYN88237.1 MAG: four helix bundle protein [Cyclobacteriaceae bacterium]